MHALMRVPWMPCIDPTCEYTSTCIIIIVVLHMLHTVGWDSMQAVHVGLTSAGVETAQPYICRSSWTYRAETYIGCAVIMMIEVRDKRLSLIPPSPIAS